MNEELTLPERLDELLDCGRQMLAAAREGDWDQAGQLQAQCHSRAEALFAKPVTADDAADIAETIAQLMELHKEVQRLCTKARGDFMRDIDKLNQGRQAVSEYSANSG